MECFVIIINGFQPLTIITKRCIWDVAAALDPPLEINLKLEITEKHVVTELVNTCSKWTIEAPEQ